MARYVTDSNLTRYDKLLKTNVKILARDTSYTVGEIVQKENNYLKCITAGTTDTSALSITGNYGTILTDGTVDWQIIDYYNETKVFNWQDGIVYEVGRIVLYDGIFYRCIVSHTANTTFDNTKWEKVGIDYDLPPKVYDWEANTDYLQYQLVLYNENVYRCNRSHTSGNLFNATVWELVYASVKDWVDSTVYNVDSMVVYDNRLYKCKALHTSSSNFYADINNWELVGSQIKEWTSGEYYRAGEVVKKDGVLYECLTNNRDATFISSNWNILSGRAVIEEWRSNSKYVPDMYVYVDNVLYRCKEAHTSDTQFGYDLIRDYWEVVFANIAAWSGNKSYLADETVENDYKMYKSTETTTSPIMSKFTWRPYVPIINDWEPYLADASQYANLMINMRFENMASAFVDDLGHFVGPNPNISARWYNTDSDNYSLPSYPGYGGYCIGTTKHGNRRYDPVMYVDLRTLYPGTLTGNDVLYQIQQDGGITIETVEYWFQAAGSNEPFRLILLSTYNQVNSYAFNDGSAWKQYGTANAWQHISYNFQISGFDPNVSGNQTVTSILDMYIDGVHVGTYTGQTRRSVGGAGNESYYLMVWARMEDATNNRFGDAGMSNLQVWRGLKRTADFTPPSSEVDLTGTRAFPYVVGEYCTYNNKLYRCTAQNTDLVWTPAHWEAISVESASAIIEDWMPSTSYAIKDLVIYNGKLYRANTAHTSDATSFNTDIANWDLIGGGGGSSIEDWSNSTYYVVGDIVTYGGSIYRCLNSHTSDSTDFSVDTLNWELLTSDLHDWSTSTYYKDGVCIIEDNKLYRCNTAHTSDALDFNNDIANWDLIAGSGGSGTGIQDWATTTDYNLGDLVIQNDTIYKCKTAHTSDKWVDDYANWQIIGMLKDWLPSTDYIEDDLVVYEHQIYKVTESFTSTNDFADNKDKVEKYVPTNLTVQQIQNIINLFHSNGYTLVEWNPNTDYRVDDLIIYGGQIYKVNTAFTSGSTFDDTFLVPFVPQGLTVKQRQEIINLFGGSPSNPARGLMDWVANTSYNQYDLIVYQGQIYQANIAITTGSTFDTTNLAMYVPNQLSSTQVSSVIDNFNP